MRVGRAGTAYVIRTGGASPSASSLMVRKGKRLISTIIKPHRK